jgi:hypothetical protein
MLIGMVSLSAGEIERVSDRSSTLKYARVQVSIFIQRTTMQLALVFDFSSALSGPCIRLINIKANYFNTLLGIVDQRGRKTFRDICLIPLN